MIERQTQRRPTFTIPLISAVLALGLGPTAIASGQGLPYRSGFGSELAYRCKAYVRIASGPHSADDLAAGYRCLGYIDGFEDGANSEFEAQTPPNPGKDYWATKALCIPSGTLDTLIKVYLAFIEKNPKYLDEVKGASLRAALHDAYPCGK